MDSMNTGIRTVVTFTSSGFNTTEPKDYFINPCCFGDDVAKWLIEQLKNQGVKTDEKPGQEDFGWYVIFSANGMPHCFVLGFRPSDDTGDGEWIGWVERCGFVRSLLGRRAKAVTRPAAEAIHRVMNASPMIHNVRWHLKHDFDRGNEAAGQRTP
jgi:hypothetical protein